MGIPSVFAMPQMSVAAKYVLVRSCHWRRGFQLM
jgi:hypothetical protein